MPSTVDKLRSLVEGLYLATESNEIGWSAEPNSDSFAAKVGLNQIEIYSEPGEHGEDIRITVYNSKGDEVDSFNDTLFGAIMPENTRHRNYFDLMSNLLTDARRSATGAIEVYDDLLDRLGKPRIGDDDVPF